MPDDFASICHYCFFIKDMAWKHAAYHINNSSPGHTRLKQQSDENLKITFASPAKNAVQKKREQEVGDNLSICMLNLLP